MTSDPSLTDGRLIHGANAEVLAYRMSIVETELSGINNKLDQWISRYPSNEVLELILNPMRQDIKEVKSQLASDQESKNRDRQQMKYTTYAAVIGPIATLVIGLIFASLSGKV